jgi:predicted anti-sigma-YlaC factor YlaD
MAHESYLNLMNLSLEGLLNQKEDADLQHHLAGCSACAAMYSRLQILEDSFSAPLFAVPPVNFSAGVMARIARYETQRQARPWFQAFLIMVIVLSIIAVSLPIVGIALGLHQQMMALPAVSGFATEVSNTYTQFSEFVWQALAGVVFWLSYVLTDPLSLSVVITALVLASTYIGLREVMRTAPLAASSS